MSIHFTGCLGTRLSSHIVLAHPTSIHQQSLLASHLLTSYPITTNTHISVTPCLDYCYSHHPANFPASTLAPFILFSSVATMILYKIRSHISSLLKSFHDFLFQSVVAKKSLHCPSVSKQSTLLSHLIPPHSLSLKPILHALLTVPPTSTFPLLSSHECCSLNVLPLVIHEAHFPTFFRTKWNSSFHNKRDL